MQQDSGKGSRCCTGTGEDDQHEKAFMWNFGQIPSLPLFKSRLCVTFQEICSVYLFTALKDTGAFCAGKNTDVRNLMYPGELLTWRVRSDVKEHFSTARL